ncbi:MAG: hypothetical protein AAFQ82_26245, partial [Myxococcota bacterium]
ISARDAARAHPESDEAKILDARLNPSLSRSLGPATSDSAPSLFSSRVYGGAQYDTNVLVLPDQQNPTDDSPEAVRAVVDAELTVQPTEQFSLRAGVNAGPHLTDDETISAFDAFAGRAVLGWSDESESLAWSLGLRNDTLFIDRSAFDLFLLAGTLYGTVTAKQGPLRLGVDVRASIRDFGASANPEDLANDRDGTRTEATAIASYQNSRWGVYGRAGYQGEHTDGVQQTENGAVASFGVRWSLEPVTLSLGAAYELRDFVANSIGRQDQRITGSGAVQIALNDTFALSANFAWTENLSSSAPSAGFLAAERLRDPEFTPESLEFSYSRQLVGLGLESRW